MRHRRILHVGTAGFFLLFGGCTDQSFERPHYVDFRSSSSNSHTAFVVIGVNGDKWFSETVDVPAGGSKRMEETFPSPGLFFATRYTIHVELEGGTTKKKSKAVKGPDGFDGFAVHIGEDDSLEIWFEDAT